MKLPDITIIDDDFDKAASFYASHSFGNFKEVCFKELKRRYKEDEDLDSLVFILAKHRVEHSTSVPVQPTDHMCDGLARDIVDWLKMDGRKTPSRLFASLELTGREAPEWLRDHPALQNRNHVPSKGACAAIVYQAMVGDYLTEVVIPE